MKETDLYPPVKGFLESQGYSVRGEVGPCDVVGVREGMMVAVEMKLTLNVRLLLQAVDRVGTADAVYIAVPHDCRTLKTEGRGLRRLLRMLGVGLLLVDPARAAVQAELDPGEYRPRSNRARKGMLLREHASLTGDPNPGGCGRKRGLMTFYRGKAVAVAVHLRSQGPSKASDVARELCLPDARAILYRNVYGWFDRASRGVYSLSPRGMSELPSWEGSAPR